ncbi:endopeptidase La [Candidatus Roizmanbacteria bacterium CG22_combo_CG10-13_8_21_14_all_38_20]|uniref:Lon protease n=1 Tax=Candidatus Roizmanbacteria bacterium CG22_combo_CG10-13_8_21_14_all_38_20 TaxID=1974862 RepID=A0A2H0BVJ4_9BACT|nr:endopeptidase La [Candidatus Microgenomates bacterium]PIP61651.1 MAG: endopeptidase La [Candidatus Roizmanbacteria bacterium CG22_combo_CG10-13_8_21_14_all_38_20]PJC30989.1 MAG: endopeptidase La [Candidatus Roizmanbacteria bacterium CG_4_9_14_0_2_um_filter_38_17]
MPIILSSNDKKEDRKLYPVVTIRDGVIFPSSESILTFGRSRTLGAVDTAMKTDKQMIVLMQKDSRVNEPQAEDLHSIGTLVKIERILKNDNDVNALVRGIKRVRVQSYKQMDPYIAVTAVEVVDKEISMTEDTEALVKHLSGDLKRAVNLGKNIDFLSFMNIMSGLNPGELSYQVASILNIKRVDKQQLLEETNVNKRLQKIAELLSHELKVLEIEKNIASKTQAKFDKSVKEAVLRERMKTIEKELGDDTTGKEFKELEDSIKKAHMPKDVHKKTMKELGKLSQMSNYNPEASYLRTYIETLIELPWQQEKSSKVSIKYAEKVLDKDHFGLKKAKERILEYLAVIKLKELRLKKKDKSYGHPTILCFVGPPGVGKTSIGRSVARSLKREFVKMSLGGIRDEAEIRGHRRTYVGALPGRIIQGMKNAGSTNPVFMLDEIDKVGADFRGDPSSALLEALDPEQNHEFVDHYLEVPYDLSDVFFITTCNNLDTIPPALRDRLEIIAFSGYTEDEKYKIADNYLMEKQLKVHALTNKDVALSKEAVKKIIERYTREAGVRNLERQIATVYRKIARMKAEGKSGKIKIAAKQLNDYLGPYRFKPLLAEIKDEVGMSTGLFWTEAGGGILFVEVALMPGKGTLKLTGQLGDVMKESAEAALSYVRSRYKELGLDENFYHSLDIHIHVPEGAVKKDGPSAGIAITTALSSALIKIPVQKDVGMTGEITLRGRVLEIGGIKEKVIAAHSAGIRKIILPTDNEKDLVDIPKYVKDDLEFVFVDHMDEVLKHALCLPKPAKANAKIPLFAQLPN